MYRVVRHACEVRLRKIDDAAAPDGGKKISQRGQFSILMVVFVTPARIAVLVFIQRLAHFVARLIEPSIEFFAGSCRAGFGLVQRLTGIMLELLGCLAGLFARPVRFVLCASAENEGKQ